MRPALLLALVSGSLALAACGSQTSTSSSGTTPGGGTGGSAVADGADSCTADADCVAIELACCDACNGGHAVAVNKAHEEATAATSDRAAGKCESTMCTEMACAPWAPTCKDGHCQLERGSF